MSYERGNMAIHLDMPDRIPHTQYISHDRFILKHTGIDSRDKNSQPLIWPALANELDYDFIWNTHEIPVQGRVTNMGHAVWSEVDQKDDEVHCPFTTGEEVLAFDPAAEYGIPDEGETVTIFRSHLEKAKELYPGAVFPGGRYNTLFSACIRTFGWEMFLGSVPHNEDRFNRVLEGFLALSMAEVRVWLKTDIEVYLCHDDIVWTSGAVFHPDWYRKYIFPKYKHLWKPLKENGIKVLFCADGDFTEFVDDIAEAGADGFIFEPATSLDSVVERYGATKVIIGNADCRVLQFGTHEDIKREVERCVGLGRECPGYFMAVGNHIPNGIPLENIEYYFEVFERLRKR